MSLSKRGGAYTCPVCGCPCAQPLLQSVACPSPACTLYDERQRVSVELDGASLTVVGCWAWERLKAEAGVT